MYISHVLALHLLIFFLLEIFTLMNIVRIECSRFGFVHFYGDFYVNEHCTYQAFSLFICLFFMEIFTLMNLVRITCSRFAFAHSFFSLWRFIHPRTVLYVSSVLAFEFCSFFLLYVSTIYYKFEYIFSIFMICTCVFFAKKRMRVMWRIYLKIDKYNIVSNF